MVRETGERDIGAYEAAYSSDYDFETIAVQFRREAVLRSLHARKPEHVIEIGCGLEPLLPHYAAQGGVVQRWVVAEPADTFVEAARKAATGHPELFVEQGFFEDLAARVVETHGKADMVICTGLLQEVPDQMRMLEAITHVMRPDSIVHVSVANASSLHRRLAQAMGLIGGLRDMSARNVMLQQHRVYDMESLLGDLRAAGLQPIRQGGILLKPFAHAQMQAILPILGDDVLLGLGKIGEQFPELASEIFVDAMLLP